MTNMMDYLLWRGDLTFEQAPFCEIDAMVFASFCYNELGTGAMGEGMTLSELAPKLDLMQRTGNLYFQQWRGLLYAMAKTRRFGGLRVHDYVTDTDAAEAKQFSAIAISLPDGVEVVAFRGTDNTIAGWHEDFNMSFESPVPAQRESVTYLNRIAGKAEGLITTGHSKGGNLAAYAAVYAKRETQAKLRAVYSFDGPGFSDETLATEAYQRILPLMHSVVPESSVVGLLLNYHQQYQIVRSDAISLWQHDAFKWHLKGPAFETVEDVNISSHIINEALHAYLADAPAEERKAMVSGMFEVLEATNATTLQEVSAAGLKNAIVMVRTTANMDDEQRKTMLEALSRIVTLGLHSTREQLNIAVPDKLRELGGRLISGVQDIQNTLIDLAEQAVRPKDGGKQA